MSEGDEAQVVTTMESCNPLNRFRSCGHIVCKNSQLKEVGIIMRAPVNESERRVMIELVGARDDDTVLMSYDKVARFIRAATIMLERQGAYPHSEDTEVNSKTSITFRPLKREYKLPPEISAGLATMRGELIQMFANGLPMGETQELYYLIAELIDSRMNLLSHLRNIELNTTQILDHAAKVQDRVQMAEKTV